MDATRRDSPDDEMEDAPEAETPEGATVGARLGDTSDLPDELLSQLVSVAASEDEDAVISVLNDDFGGIGTLDEILVSLWRATGAVHERKTLAARITRMVKKGSIESVEGRRGVYKTSK